MKSVVVLADLRFPECGFGKLIFPHRENFLAIPSTDRVASHKREWKPAGIASRKKGIERESRGILIPAVAVLSVYRYYIRLLLKVVVAHLDDRARNRAHEKSRVSAPKNFCSIHVMLLIPVIVPMILVPVIKQSEP